MRADAGAEPAGGLGRLKKRREFKAAAAGRRVHSQFMTLQAGRSSQGDAPARLGLTVTRKEGNAVERNRIRRRLREAARLIHSGGPRPGHDYVIIARRALLGAPFVRVIADLDAAFVRVHTGREKTKADGGKPHTTTKPQKV